MSDFGGSGAVLDVPSSLTNPRAGQPPQPIYQANVAPAFKLASGDCVALLGEAGKVTAVSAYRFAKVSMVGQTLHTILRGQDKEKVPLLFAKSVGCHGDWKVSSVTATIGADGTGTATF